MPRAPQGAGKRGFMIEPSGATTRIGRAKLSQCGISELITERSAA